MEFLTILCLRCYKIMIDVGGRVNMSKGCGKEVRQWDDKNNKFV